MNAQTMSDKKRILIFINIVISCIASSMLQTALNTALYPMAADLNIAVTTIQWLASGFSLTMAIAMPLTAFLINRFPTRKLYLAAVSMFIFGLALCAVSTNFPMMMIGRVIQAVGNGMLTSMSQVITLTIFPPEKRGVAMGWYGLSVGAAPIIAPVIAGVLVDSVGWRMIFVLSLIIMVVALVYALLCFENVLETRKSKFDVLSFALSGVAFGGITLGVGNIGAYPLLSPQVLIALIAGILGGVGFVKRQLAISEPFLDVRILKSKQYAVSVAGSMLLYFVMMGSTILLPLYVQQALGRSATDSALMMLPGSAVSAIISPLAGKLYDRMGIRKLFISGAALLLLSNLWMAFIGVDTPLYIAAISNIIRSIAIAFLMMPLVTWGAASVSSSKTSHATALLTSLRTIAGAIGSAVFVAVMSVVGAHNTSMFGVNMAFLVMSVFCVFMLLLALWGTKKSADTFSLDLRP